MSARNSREAKIARNAAAAADLARRNALRASAGDLLAEKMRNEVRKIANAHNYRLGISSERQLREAHAGRVAEGETLPNIGRRTTREELIEMLTITLADEDIIIDNQGEGNEESEGV